MEYLKIIIPILVGALIGYCTNYIAIKMLFRPRKPVFVFGKKLPFTPGVIPKNQPRIASAVGKAVGQNLFTNDDIVAAITESDLKEHLFEKIKETVFDNDSSLKDYITEYSLKKENENVAENNILSRHLRVNDKMMKKYDEFNDLNDDEKAILHIMYNTGEKMTTALAARITNRGRNFASKLLKSLVNKEILEWHGTSKQDRNQYYTLAE